MGNERGFRETEGNNAATLVAVNLFRLPLPPWGCSVWCTNVIALSMGQLPFQILQPCTYNGFALWSLPFGVM